MFVLGDHRILYCYNFYFNLSFLIIIYLAPGIADLASSEWAAEYMSSEVQRAEGICMDNKY